jgi:hypothetical protein
VNLEDRLYAIMREAVGSEYKSFFEIAKKVHDAQPIEFTYNRLGAPHVAQPESIVSYISLLHFLDLIVTNDDDAFVCFVNKVPNEEGTKSLIVSRAIEKLEKAQFSRPSFRNAVRNMLSLRQPIVPGLREVYDYMALSLSEANFMRLARLVDVRTHFGFSVSTRTLMIPTTTKREGNEKKRKNGK